MDRDSSADPGAVDGGADGVGDADAALGGDAGGVAGLDPAALDHVLEAVARGTPVGGGPCGAGERPDAAAALGGRAGPAASVGQAGGQGRAHLTTVDGVGSVRNREEHRHHHGGHHELGSCSTGHLDLLNLELELAAPASTSCKLEGRIARFAR